jgi:NAD(P)-dependent dehydrogenase (short-subunit alcohol dehydrogenase family)
MQPSEIKHKSILITGCSSGIGLCVAHGLRTRGYRVFASARKQGDVEMLLQQGFEAIQLDLNQADSIKNALTRVLELTGGELYALFNNGAYGQPGAVEDLSTDLLREQFETNLFGWHELTRQVIPVMRRQGFGRIIQNSSILGFVTFPFRGAYNASKYALEGLTDTMRLELHGSGIHLSLIEPGPIESRFRQNSFLKWQQNIAGKPSVHQDTYHKQEQRLSSEDAPTPFTLPPEAVLKRVIHALESPRPKPRYFVTFPTYLFAVLKRILPVRMLDAALLKISG